MRAVLKVAVVLLERRVLYDVSVRGMVSSIRAEGHRTHAARHLVAGDARTLLQLGDLFGSGVDQHRQVFGTRGELTGFARQK